MDRYNSIIIVIIICLFGLPCHAAIKIKTGGSFADVNAVNNQISGSFKKVTPKYGSEWYALIEYLTHDYYLYVVWGQSNAQGAGDSTASTPCTTGKEIHTDDSLENTVADPVGQDIPPTAGGFHLAATGSAWPSFATEFENQTGKNVIILSTAAGGSGLCTSFGYGQWISGDLWSDAIGFLDDALTYLDTTELDYKFAGIIWWQGETDASTISTATYKTALQTLISNTHAEFSGYDFNFYLVKIMDAYGQSVIRDADDAVADADENVFVVENDYTNAGNHHTQAQYNAIGVDIAETVAGRL